MDNKLSAIVEGWKNFIFHDPEIEKIALERAKICSTCDENTFSICKLCGCPLASKTRSTKSTNLCPLNKWDKINTDNGNTK